MTTFEFLADRHALAARRGFVRPGGALSAVGLALLAQPLHSAQPAEKAMQPQRKRAALDLLRCALDVESGAAGSYEELLENGVPDTAIRAQALLFQRHHRAHSTALERAIKACGGALGRTAAPATHPSHGKGPLVAHDLHAALVRLARLERSTCQRHLQAAANHPDAGHAPLLMRLAAQCAVHYGAWARATGEPLEA